MTTHDTQPGPEKREALLVDDDAALRGLLSVLLQQMGFSATCARNGTEALDILTAEGQDKFKVLITDIRMPQMGGIELARKARLERPGLPILFISGYTPSMTEVENELDELSDFLKKPFEFTSFSRALEALLKHAEDAGSAPEKREGSGPAAIPYRRTG